VALVRLMTKIFDWLVILSVASGISEADDWNIWLTSCIK
jgi:hypothetical protein